MGLVGRTCRQSQFDDSEHRPFVVLANKGKDLDHLQSLPGFFKQALLQQSEGSGSSENGAPLHRAPGLRWMTAR